MVHQLATAGRLLAKLVVMSGSGKARRQPQFHTCMNPEDGLRNGNAHTSACFASLCVQASGVLSLQRRDLRNVTGRNEDSAHHLHTVGLT